MAILIPIAVDASGEAVTPTCRKEQGPFKCIGCSKRLTLKQGEVNRWHFAHASADTNDCSAGGESYNHRAAKMILVKYITRFGFTQRCHSGKHAFTRKYDGCTASEEFRYDGSHSADVAVFLPENKLKAIVEVKVSHSTEGDSLESRISRVGSGNVWEVDAMDVLNSQKTLTLTTDPVTMPSLISTTVCKPCSEIFSQVKVEIPMYTPSKYESREPDPPAVVEIIDRDTLRRNGVLLRKVFNHPDDSCDRGYMWSRA